MSIITVPGVLVARVREGARAIVGDIAEAIDHGENLKDCRDRLISLCALFDAIAGEGAVDLDMAEHGPMLTVAVGHVLPVLATGVADMNDADPRKPGRQQEYRLLCEFAAILRGLERDQ
jgi:hypothetical protein